MNNRKINPAHLNSLTRIVPVIASFDAAGNVKPIYIKINSEQYKIISCYSQDLGPLTIYTCTVNNQGMQREIKITYHDRDRYWTTQF